MFCFIRKYKILGRQCLIVVHTQVKEGQVPKGIIKPNQLQTICGDWENYLKQAQSTP
jgi:hypothetical protein